MILAITRLPEKGEEDRAMCRRYGHFCYTVSPLRAEILQDQIRACADAVNRGEYDGLFFSSALPAKILGPLIRRWPRTIAIGPHTAKTLSAWFEGVETLPSFYSRDFVPYLGEWLRGKNIGIPRADVPNPDLIQMIQNAGGIPHEVRCYRLEPTHKPLDTKNAQGLLFTSAGSFRDAVWENRPNLLLLAIGDVTAAAMTKSGFEPSVVGDGSLEGTLQALNRYQEKIPAEPVKIPSAGIILVNKPRGPSSHQVAAWVRDLLQVPVGHSGTLDPRVSGILVVMLGRAMRLAPLLLQSEKEYVCVMRLHGEVDPRELDRVIKEFTGRIYQRPPRKSAVKRNLRIRTIHRIDLLDVQERDVLLRVQCDAGTYIRSLCHHVGYALGVGAHLQELRRTRSGSFSEKEIHTLQEIREVLESAQAGRQKSLQDLILPPVSAVMDLPRIVIRDQAVDAVCHGAVLARVGVLEFSPFRRQETVAILSRKGELVGLGTALVDSTLLSALNSGLVVSPRVIVMERGTYPRGWKKE